MYDDYFFEGGYSELYLYKFKQYESSVGKYIRDQQLKNHPYRYDENLNLQPKQVKEENE